MPLEPLSSWVLLSPWARFSHTLMATLSVVWALNYRESRRVFWWHSGVILSLDLTLSLGLEALEALGVPFFTTEASVGEGLADALTVFLVWSLFSAMVRRMHDAGISPRHLAWMLLCPPLILLLWLVLGIKPSAKGPLDWPRWQSLWD